MTIKEAERLLEEKILFIQNYEKLVKETSDCVYGKTIRRVGANGLEEEHELETWTYEVIFNNLEVLKNKEFYEAISRGLRRYEEDFKMPREDRQNYTCYQMFDWYYLMGESGNIIKKKEVTENGEPKTIYSITFVKYAKVLKDLI